MSGFPFALTDRCVRCGLCLPHCPTYRDARSEAEGPRGRIQIMESVAAARIELTATGAAHVDHCLGCGHCARVCPAKVDYLTIRDHFAARRLTRWQRAKLALLSRPAWAGLRRLLVGLAARWPAALTPPPLRAGRALSAARPAPRPAFAQALPAAPAAPGDWALFRGCQAASFDARAQASAGRLLGALGVTHPAPTQCCGALPQHGGALAQAAQLRAQLAGEDRGDGQEQGEDAKPTLLALDSGCLDALRASGRGVQEACAWLDAHWPQAWQPAALPRRYALHTPCTHRNAADDSAAVRRLLGRIPQLELLPIEGLGCCGAAGLHMLEQPAHAARFSQALLAQLPDGVDGLLSTNIGCRAQLRTQAPELAIRHPLEVVEEALRRPATTTNTPTPA